MPIPPTMRLRDSDDEEAEAYARVVIGAAIEVHRHLEPGYLESVYEEALAIEFDMQEIPFEKQKPIALCYKGHPVGEGRIDFLVGESLVVELKAVEALGPIHHAQVISYLRTTKLSLGLLINFKVSILRDGVKRVICT